MDGFFVVNGERYDTIRHDHDLMNSYENMQAQDMEGSFSISLVEREGKGTSSVFFCLLLSSGVLDRGLNEWVFGLI